jgi:hypothetical protein
MKTPKVITDVEHQAARQLNLLMRTVRQQYNRFVPGGSKTSTAVAQRRFIRSVEKTIESAEKTIAKLKPRIAAVKRSLGGTRKKKVKRAKAATRRTPARKRTAKARKKKL